jgi:hypothetical protein
MPLSPEGRSPTQNFTGGLQKNGKNVPDVDDLASERTTANDEFVKNMLHLGYYDTYTIDSNGNYVVTRQTGYG